MRIACLINSLTTGGAEQQFVQLAEHLAKKHEVTLYTIEADEELQPPNVPRVPLSKLLRTTPPLKKGAYYPFIWKKLYQRLNAKPPNIIVSFLELSNLFAIRASHPLNLPCLVSVRCFPSGWYGTGYYGWVFRKLITHYYPKATVVVANSNASKNDLITNFGLEEKQVSVIHNWVDIKNIKIKAEEKLTGDEKRLFSRTGRSVISVGRLTKAKGYKHLISAFKMVEEWLPGTRLIIVGEGEERARLEKLIKRSGLQGRVVLAGRKTNPFKLMKRADLFVMSSLWEGFPNALLEAMAVGLPVISTDCQSGPGEILVQNSGVLTPPLEEGEESLKKLSEAIVSLLKDERRREELVRNAQERVKAFAKERQLKQFEQLIEETVKHPPKRKRLL